MKEGTAIFFKALARPGTYRIILDPGRTVLTDKPARRHRKKRIAKKWLKRYGYKAEPDRNIYLYEGNQIILHPAMFQMIAAEAGSPEEAAKTIIKCFSRGQQ